ncbi:MAG TPA: hypothetical protein VIK89_12975 [Cytophagaceae bacterium]
MKYTTILILLLHYSVFGQNLVEYKGVYTGENKYVHNPFADFTFAKFCIDSIKINKILYDLGINSSTLQLDLRSLGFSLGDSVTIAIYHSNNCKPLILNPRYYPKISKVRFDSITISNNGILTFKTFNDSIGVRPDLIVEQRQFNRWIEVSKIQQKWNFENIYATKVSLLPGTNKFRIKTYSSMSDTIIFDVKQPPVSYQSDSINRKIFFEDSVSFELQNGVGSTYIKGIEQTIDLSFLKNGEYKLYYDNEVIKFCIRKKRLFIHKL